VQVGGEWRALGHQTQPLHYTLLSLADACSFGLTVERAIVTMYGEHGEVTSLIPHCGMNYCETLDNSGASGCL